MFGDSEGSSLFMSVSSFLGQRTRQRRCIPVGCVGQLGGDVKEAA